MKILPQYSTKNDYSLWKYRKASVRLVKLQFSINLMIRNCNLAIVDTRFDVAFLHCRILVAFHATGTTIPLEIIVFLAFNGHLLKSNRSNLSIQSKWSRCRYLWRRESWKKVNRRERERERARWNCSSSWDSRQYARPFYSRGIYSRESFCRS